LPRERIVFVADDSPLAREAVARRLRKAGLRVVEGESAVLDPALDVASFACALVDLDLGDGDGPQLAEALRRIAPALPIAFFSAGAPAELMDRATTWGKVFAKPAELDDAVAWVRSQAG
jgi:DNA-binding response OmpR family regulator